MGDDDDGTEHDNSRGKIYDLRSEGTRFESRAKERLFEMRPFMLFLCISR
jgi:hypothetical protein